MMKVISGGLMLIALLAGIWAAWLWWKSSRISIPWQGPEEHESGDKDFALIGAQAVAQKNLFDITKAARDSGRMNGKAALWTAASVVGQVLATALGWLASYCAC